ncbi:hypothetical protein MAL08_12080 [Leptospira noguchii]|uniref:hypothetical protein n=1 Tax=Leptospira noguchii TaxID=28182 RepID=UPI0002C020F2|nr:hypothetical protein [Leptospira noguchii]EMI72473.1 hypothetical protein LEP1GSC072_3001 [Leptospira noguchii str. Bonito]UOG36843.1 hypothetical protein MAL08_12080 [Leptospira noguchii]
MWELLLLENSFSFSYAEPALHIHFWIKDFNCFYVSLILKELVRAKTGLNVRDYFGSKIF